jgi:hypothetical protein
MKQLFKNKFVEVSLIKGFVFGIGFNDSNTNFILFVGPIGFEFLIKEKRKLTNEL